MLSILVCHSYFLRLDPEATGARQAIPGARHAASGRDAAKGRAPSILFRRDARRRHRGIRARALRRCAAGGAALRGHVQFLEQNVLEHDAPRSLRNDRLGAARRRQSDRGRPRCQRCPGALPQGRRGCGSHRRRSVGASGAAAAARFAASMRSSDELIDGLYGVAALSQGEGRHRQRRTGSAQSPL